MEEARRIKATCTLAGKSGSVHEVTISSSLNGFATCSVQFHDAGSGGDAGKVLNKEMIGGLAAKQRSMFSVRDAPDMTLKFEDGQGGTLDFSGFISQPAFEASESNIASLAAGTHPSAQLDSLNLHIYASPAGTTDYTIESEPKGASWSDRISKLVELAYKKWEGSYSALDDPGGVKASIHAQNRKLVPILVGLLKASETSTTQAALGKMQEHFGVNAAINSFLTLTLLTPRLGFLATLLAINDSLRMVYVPTLAKGEYGQLVLMSEIFKNTVTKKAGMLRGNASLGAMRSLPVGQVVVLGAGGSDFLTLKQLAAGQTPKQTVPTQSMVVCYPENPVPGAQILPAPIPAFIPYPISPAPFMDETSSFISSMRAGPQLKMFQQASLDLEEFKNGPIADLIREYAKGVYVDTAIAGASVSLVTDLDLSWKIGQHYEVTSGSGSMFKGILTSFTHSANISENQASASSSLLFTHVEMSGFELPNR